MKWPQKLFRAGRGKPRNGPNAAPAPDLPGYSNINEVANSAFAAVYRAVELGTSRPVALKVLHTAGSPAQAVELFNEQLPDLLLLSKHPNVVTLYRSFLAPGGQPVLAMELCRESFAQDLVETGPLLPTDVVPVAIKIAGALESAHRAGLVHGDMKPENILVTQFGEPELADLGLAGLRTIAESTERLAGATTLHTAPEVLEGAAPSPSADVYGLASAMYQLIVGRGPFVTYDGERSASVILRVLRDPAPRPSLSSMPIVLADLLEAALAKDPLARPPSALSFAEALQGVEAIAGWPRTRFVAWGPAELDAVRTGVALLQPVRTGDTRSRADRDDAPGPAGEIGRDTGGDTRAYAFERAKGADGGGDEAEGEERAGHGAVTEDTGKEHLLPAEPVHDPYAFWDYLAISPEFTPRTSVEPSVPGRRRVVAPPPVERTVIVPQPMAPRQQPVVLPEPPPALEAGNAGQPTGSTSGSDNDQDETGDGK